MLPSSQSVIAFEPRPAQASDLASMFAAVGAAVRVEAVALSDTPGVTAMRVLESDPGRSTIDAANALGDADNGAVRTIDVPVQRLDDLPLDDVGLIKIDVEGHELAVLRGATATLTRNRPTVVVEAEERHHPHAVAAITEFLARLGYAGYFDIGAARHPIDEFDAARHQDPANIGTSADGWEARGVYVNNFLFLRQGRPFPPGGATFSSRRGDLFSRRGDLFLPEGRPSGRRVRHLTVGVGVSRFARQRCLGGICPRIIRRPP